MFAPRAACFAGLLQAWVSVARMRRFLLQHEHPRGALWDSPSTSSTSSHRAPPKRPTGASSGVAPPAATTAALSASSGPPAPSAAASPGAGAEPPAAAVLDHAWFSWQHPQVGPLAQPHGSKAPPGLGGGRAATPHAQPAQEQAQEAAAPWEAQCCLRDVTLRVPAGRLTAVTGQVRSTLVLCPALLLIDPPCAGGRSWEASARTCPQSGTRSGFMV